MKRLSCVAVMKGERSPAELGSVMTVKGRSAQAAALQLHLCSPGLGEVLGAHGLTLVQAPG